MSEYQGESSQYVVPSSEEKNSIQANAVYCDCLCHCAERNRLSQLQAENEYLKKHLDIISRMVFKFKMENIELREQNRQLKSRWLTKICITVTALFCLALIAYVWN